MYLKNIALRGFKSFKDKSQLFFEPGISVIVGPNGSGKSNIADAISWVLGEQSPKTLRGNSMADVIFKNKNEEMGIAEVSLVFDNSNRLFNTEFREVKFTRRVYSKGGSEYFVNSSPCRLIDIQELTADSGIGKGLHIIVNQGQINEIALLKPAERKAVIDEVLGISKHKIRRDKSLVKLQKVKNDIDRIDDLISEIKRTMDPLEIEAKRAREYSEIFNKLKDEEISLFIAHLNNLNNEWEEENNSCIKNENRLKEINIEISNLENEKNRLLNLTGREQGEYEALRNKIDWFTSEINNLKNIIALAESKKNVFKTLSSMFDIELKHYRKNKGKIINIAEDNSSSGLQSLLKKVSHKLDEVINLLGEFLAGLKKKIKAGATEDYIKNESRIIMNQIMKLSKTVKNEVKNMDIAAKKEADGKVKVNRKNSDERLNQLRNLKKICIFNIERAHKLHLILKNYLQVSEKIGKRLYPEFEKRNDLISKNRDSINNLEMEIARLNITKSKLENSLYKSELKKEQIKEKVEAVTENIIDNYNISVDYALKSYTPASGIRESEAVVKKLKNRIRNYGNVNPNAAVEYQRIKKRYDFLEAQRSDLAESKKNLEELIRDINKRIADYFYRKFEEIKKCFRNYFKILFPLGEGEMQLEKENDSRNSDDEVGVDLKVDIGNNKFVSLSLLSGGEKSLVSTAFLFSIYSINPSPFYVFDEVDAALDDVNIGRFLTLIKKFSEKQQIILITHQKRTMEIADTIYGVTMQPDGISKIISEKINKKYAKAN